MYPYLRVAGVLAGSLVKPRLRIDDTSELRLRVWPGDIDLYPEMNNGRFWTVMDLGRYDLAARTGLVRTAHRMGWLFVVAGGSIRYRRRLPPFGRFLLRTSLVGHDGRWFYFDQEFVRGGRMAAQAVVRAGLRTAKTAIPAQTVLEALGRGDWAPPLPDWIRAWIEAEETRPSI
ncbi:MAG: thioesterase family protein [Candidatus Aminicenantes bacterium]|nr:thioesterase family protein [Candidatus Aminicenantes bacterium]